MIVSSTFSLFIKPNSWNRYCLFRGIRHGIVPFVGDSGYRYCRGNCHPWLARGLRRRCPTMERRLSWNYWRFRQKKSIFMSELLLLVWERNKNIFIGSPSHSLYFLSHSFTHSFREFQSFSFTAATFPWGMTLWGSIELCSRFFPWRSSLLRNSWAVIVFDEFAQCGFWMQLWWTYTKPVFYY